MWPSDCLDPESLLALPKTTTIWDKKITCSWDISEGAALSMHERFLSVGLQITRNPGTGQTWKLCGRLSPYIRHGQISPSTIYWSVVDSNLSKQATKTFGRRLFWRDLAYFQFDQFPSMHSDGIRKHYDKTDWCNDLSKLKAWQSGCTGFPMVDSGMRELYATGYMKQNVRMVVASFLVEYLGMDWRHGLRWFHECLVDADVSINSMMWQNAGRSGIDQWNFVLRPDSGASRDPRGAYVRKWVPELKSVPTKYIFSPWEADAAVLQKAGVVIGRRPEDGSGSSLSFYPERIIKNLSKGVVRRIRKLFSG